MKLYDVLVFKFDHASSNHPPFKAYGGCSSRIDGQTDDQTEDQTGFIKHNCNTITGKLIKLVQT